MLIENNSAMLVATVDNGNDSFKEFFQALFYSEKYKDLTFIVARKEVHVNEIVVKTRSSVLKARIKDPERIPNGRILLDDPSLDHFMEFLKFLYLDDCEINEMNIIGLFFLGKKYNVPTLCRKCLDIFDTVLNRYNIQNFVETSIKHPFMYEIFQKCFFSVPSYISYLTFCKIDESGAITANFSPALIQLILEQNRPAEAEDALFRKVFEWAKIHRQDVKEEPANLKEAMKDFIPYIRFENLKKITLATVVRQNDLLTTEELLKLFIKFATGKIDANHEIAISQVAVKKEELSGL